MCTYYINVFLGGGRLFEPKTLTENRLVYKVAKNIIDLRTNGAWIGVTDKSFEGSFKYDSNGSPVSFSRFFPLTIVFCLLFELDRHG